MSVKSIIISLCLFAVLQTGVYGYDDFSTALIDANKWMDIDFVRHIVESDGNGVLLLGVRTLSSGERINNTLSSNHKQPLKGFKTRMRVNRVFPSEESIDETSRVESLIGGTIYGSCYDLEEDRIRPIRVEAFIFSTGEELSIGWRVLKVHEKSNSVPKKTLHTEVLSLSEPIVLNTYYEFTIHYQPFAEKIHLTVLSSDSDRIIAETSYKHEERIIPISDPEISLSTTAEHENTFITASFDYLDIVPVFAKEEIRYDDFDPEEPINPERWNKREAVRVIENSKLHIKLGSEGKKSISKKIRLKEKTDYIKTRIQIKSDTRFEDNSGNSGSATLDLPLFSESLKTTIQDSMIDQYRGILQLTVNSDRTIKAEGEIIKCLDDTCSTRTSLFKDEFSSLSFAFDTEYFISVDLKSDGVTFTIDDESVTYLFEAGVIIDGILNASTAINVTLNGDENKGKLALFHVTFDDVSIEKKDTPDPEDPGNNDCNDDCWLRPCFVSTLSGNAFDVTALLFFSVLFCLMVRIPFKIKRKKKCIG